MIGSNALRTDLTEPLTRTRSQHLLILVALFVSTTGDEIALVALALKAAQQSGALASVSVLLVAGLLPGVLLSHPIALAADRYPVKRLLAVVLLVQVVIAGAAALVSGQWALAGVAALLGGFGSVAHAATLVLVPRLFAGEQLLKANSMLETARSTGSILGPLAAGGLIALIGTGGALLVDAASFAVDLLIVVLAIPAVASATHPAETAEPTRAGSGLRAGLQMLWGDPVIRRALLPLVFVVVTNSVMNVALPFFARDVGTSGFYGVAVAAWSAGLLIGPQLLLTRLGKAAPVTLILVASAGVGVGQAGAGGFAVPALVLVFFVVGGVCNALVLVSMRNLIMTRSPDGQRGSIGAAYGATMQTAVIVGFLTAAPAPEHSARWVVLIGGLLAVSAGVAGLIAGQRGKILARGLR